jgi:hypothetical protein
MTLHSPFDSRSATTRHRSVAVLGAVIGVLLLYWSMRDVQWGALRNALREVDLRFLPAIAVVYVAVFWCKAWRLSCAMALVRTLPARELFPVTFASNVGNLVLPAYAGEITRAYLLSRATRAPLASLLSATLVERLLDFLVLLGLVAWLLVWGNLVSPELERGALWLAVGMLILMTALWLAVLAAPRIVALAPGLGPGTSRRSRLLVAASRSIGPVLGVVKSMAAPRLIAGLIASSLLHWGLLGLCTLLALQSAGIDAGTGEAIAVLALVTAAMSLPSSPGWIGAVQAGFVFALRPAGVDDSIAVAASIAFHVTIYSTALVLGLAFMRKLGLGWREIAQRPEPAKAVLPE